MTDVKYIEFKRRKIEEWRKRRQTNTSPGPPTRREMLLDWLKIKDKEPRKNCLALSIIVVN
jgi:hypothetical protein